jgi:hypothetical protein
MLHRIYIATVGSPAPSLRELKATPRSAVEPGSFWKMEAIRRILTGTDLSSVTFTLPDEAVASTAPVMATSKESFAPPDVPPVKDAGTQDAPPEST